VVADCVVVADCFIVTAQNMSEACLVLYMQSPTLPKCFALQPWKTLYSKGT
jgi:hypothetical protein